MCEDQQLYFMAHNFKSKLTSTQTYQSNNIIVGNGLAPSEQKSAQAWPGNPLVQHFIYSEFDQYSGKDYERP